MTNFTREPVLSFLITFGIQGVLFVVSWLIGESFANGVPSRETSDALTNHRTSSWPMKTLGVPLFAVIAIMFVTSVTLGVSEFGGQEWSWFGTVDRGSSAAVIILSIILLVALVGGGRQLFDHLSRIARMTARNAVLWLMFAACLLGSVAFSFDSLFTTIFSTDERERSAKVRIESNVAALLIETDRAADAWQRKTQNHLTSSEQWATYKERINQLSDKGMQELPRLRDRSAEQGKNLNDRIADKEVALAETREELADLKKSLAVDRNQLHRYEAEFNGYQKHIYALKEKLLLTNNALENIRKEARLEAEGVGRSGKKGRGPTYRSILRSARELEARQRKLHSELAAQRQALERQRANIVRLRKRIASSTRSFARQRAHFESVTSGLARLRNDIAGVEGPIKPAAVTASIGRVQAAVRAFERSPTSLRLSELESRCFTLSKSLGTVEEGNRRIGAEETCFAGNVRAVAGEAFMAVAGLARLRERCGRKEATSANATVDDILKFARSCIQFSGIPGKQNAALHHRLSSLTLSRDDQAHRFVVTINAIKDGNNLAHLALAIALAIDGLVFASGLFGAAAVRSPLSDIADPAARSARRMELIIDGTLMPNRAQGATIALQHIRPKRFDAVEVRDSGWTHELDLATVSRRHRNVLAKLLAGAATIDAARQFSCRNDNYDLRYQLVEYLVEIAAAVEALEETHDSSQSVVQKLKMALSPNVQENAAQAFSYLEPLQSGQGFSTMVTLKDIPDQHRSLMKCVLNVAASLNLVRQPLKRQPPNSFQVHRKVLNALLLLAAKDARPSEVDNLDSDDAPELLQLGSVAVAPAAPDELGRDNNALAAEKPEVEAISRMECSTNGPDPSRSGSTLKTCLRQRVGSGRKQRTFTKRSRDSSPSIANPTVEATNELVRRLFTACGVEGDLPPGGVALSAARHIWEMLQKFAIEHPEVSVRLSEYEIGKLEALEAACEKMRSDEAKADGRVEEQVNSARATVEACWPAVLVAAAQGAVSQLYMQLASHKPSQTVDSGKLLQQVQIVRNCAARLRWSSTEDWRELERLVTSLLDRTRISKPLGQDESLEHSVKATEEILFSTITLPEVGRTLLADELLGEKRGRR